MIKLRKTPQSLATLDRGVHAASSLARKSALKRPEGRAPWPFAFHPVGEVLVPVGKDWGQTSRKNFAIVCLRQTCFARGSIFRQRYDT
jgi:hypothetical protein